MSEYNEKLKLVKLLATGDLNRGLSQEEIQAMRTVLKRLEALERVAEAATEIRMFDAMRCGLYDALVAVGKG